VEPSQNHSGSTEQRTAKARNQGTTEGSHVGHCVHTSDSINVKVLTFSESTGFVHKQV